MRVIEKAKRQNDRPYDMLLKKETGFRKKVCMVAASLKQRKAKAKRKKAAKLQA